MDFSYRNYKDILKKLIEENYYFSFFDEVIDKKKVYLRHDVDLDIKGAYNLALIESELGVKSTWFVMPNNRLYNLLDLDVINLLNEMVKMGHKIGLHIDASNVNSKEDLEDKLCSFYRFYSNYFELEKVFSFHIPNKELFDNDVKINGFINTYEAKFFHDIVYVSDSNRREFLSEDRFLYAINNNLNIQLLTHPVWWNEENILKDGIKEYLKNYTYDLVIKSCDECKF